MPSRYHSKLFRRLSPRFDAFARLVTALLRLCISPRSRTSPWRSLAYLYYAIAYRSITQPCRNTPNLSIALLCRSTPKLYGTKPLHFLSLQLAAFAFPFTALPCLSFSDQNITSLFLCDANNSQHILAFSFILNLSVPRCTMPLQITATQNPALPSLTISFHRFTFAERPLSLLSFAFALSRSAVPRTAFAYLNCHCFSVPFPRFTFPCHSFALYHISFATRPHALLHLFSSVSCLASPRSAFASRRLSNQGRATPLPVFA